MTHNTVPHEGVGWLNIL